MKIIIIGKGHGWELAPKEGETWGMTQLILRRPVSLVVDMNDYSLWGPVEEREARCARELALKTGVPYIDLMNYPLESIKNVFQTDYFSNTVDYSIALALYRGCTELDFYGVNMASGSEYCVSPETKVLTTDLRYVPAKKIKVGQELIGFDEHIIMKGRHWKKAITEVVQKLRRPCYRLTMEDGSVLVSSSEHRWLCNSAHENKWIETNQLRPRGFYKNGRCSHICKPLEVWEEDESHDAGYLAGAFDGEGHLSQNGYESVRSEKISMALGFSQRNNAMRDNVEKILRGKHFDFSRYNSKEDCYKYTVSGGKREVIRFLGQIRPLRLLDKFNVDIMGCIRTTHHVAVLKKEYIGEQEVIGLKTSTGTFIAEGFASHNSYEKPGVDHWVGRAQGMGVKVRIFGEHSTILRTRDGKLYGYGTPQTMPRA
jgi:hypothetical protein